LRAPDTTAAPASTPGVSAATADPATTAVPVDTAALGATSPRLSVTQLTQAVRDGSLEGRLVFLDGDLSALPAPCEGASDPGGGCVTLAVKGLGLAVRAGPSEVPWRGDPAPGTWLVTVARGGGLVYLGSLAPSRDGPLPIELLTARLLARELNAPPRTEFEVQGWLVVNPVHRCDTRDPAATPCPAPAPFVADDEPLEGGILRSSRGGTVDLAAPLIDVEASATVTKGTFLVELPAGGGCNEPSQSSGCGDAAVRWRVVARYDPARAVRALVP
jgi:hypothetical protein